MSSQSRRSSGGPTLYLLTGLPCSGKSTYARSLEATGVSRVSVDDLMIAAHGRLGTDYEASQHHALLGPIVEAATDAVVDHLRAGRSVVLDHGLGERAQRDEMKQLARSHSAAWRLLCFDAPLEVLQQRCRARAADPQAVPISDDTLNFLASVWQRPESEGQDLVHTEAMVTSARIEEFELVRQLVIDWAASDERVEAVVLVGSWARGTASMDSDADVVVLTQSDDFVEHDHWVSDLFGEHASLVRTADWGAITERRVQLASGFEIEFGFGQPTWADVTPLDRGTQEVIADGAAAWHDPAGRVSQLIAAVTSPT